MPSDQGKAAAHAEPATPVGPDERTAALAQVVASKVERGFWVESQSATEARLIAPGRKRWLGLFGPRVPERREIVRVDEQGRTRLERLPARRY